MTHGAESHSNLREFVYVESGLLLAVKFMTIGSSAGQAEFSGLPLRLCMVSNAVSEERRLDGGFGSTVDCRIKFPFRDMAAVVSPFSTLQFQVRIDEIIAQAFAQGV